MTLLTTPADGGSVYTETNLNHFFPEPLNTVTSCFFLGIALYWTFRLRNQHQQHLYLSFALLLLYIGGIGGTLYHGLRRWHFFIMMDWVPIMLLCLSAGVYFLSKLMKWYYAMLAVVLYLGIQFWLRTVISKQDIQLLININYAMMATLVLLPVLAYLIHSNWKHGKWVGIALVSFICALTFRIADQWHWLDSGTHFLWHSFGAIASFCMFNYIFLVNQQPLVVPKK
eukprot:gene11768-13728_t